MRLGPLALTPTVSLTNFGIDSNVFNDADNPKRDFTATLTPKAEARVRLGRARVVANSALDFVYFRQYASQRSVNLHNDVRLELPLNRIVPSIGSSSVNTKERPGNDIDSRAHRTENTVTLGGSIRVSGKTMLDAAARTSHTGFARDATFLGFDLREALNERVSAVRASVRYNVTPLTKLVLLTETQRDRFEFSSIRNADSLRLMPGVEFASFALVTGKANVGFRKFTPLDTSVPAFAGAVADVELAYTLLGTTRFTLHGNRDLAYSYEPAEPYYVTTSVSGSLARHVGGPWDVLGSIGRQRLDYRSIQGGAAPLPHTGRTDVVSNYGAGLGYRLDRNTRLDLKLDYYRRRSPVAFYRDYDGFRFATSVTYGLR